MYIGLSTCIQIITVFYQVIPLPFFFVYRQAVQCAQLVNKILNISSSFSFDVIMSPDLVRLGIFFTHRNYTVPIPMSLTSSHIVQTCFRGILSELKVGPGRQGRRPGTL